MSDRESRWIPAKDALNAMARAFVVDMQTDLDEARARSRATIVRYLAAGHWPARAGAYHCEFRSINGAGRKLERVPNSENDGWIIPQEYWQIVQNSGAHEDANWHLGEFDLPPFDNGSGVYSGFARNVEFDRFYIPQQCLAPTTEERAGTGDPGRPELGKTLYLRELERRIRAGSLERSVAAQARVLHAWFCAQYPDRQAPKPGTIENRIRDIYRQAMSATK